MTIKQRLFSERSWRSFDRVDAAILVAVGLAAYGLTTLIA